MDNVFKIYRLKTHKSSHKSHIAQLSNKAYVDYFINGDFARQYQDYLVSVLLQELKKPAQF